MMAENKGTGERLLEIKGLRKSFRHNPVISKFDLEVAAGEFLGLTGSSGCGKTTLLRLIAGLEEPDEGEIRLEGTVISARNHVLPPYRRRMGMVFQQLALWPHLTVGQHLEYGLDGISFELRRERVESMLAKLQIASYRDRFPHQLSGGERQRVALGRALVTNPAILLCDEPFTSLDQNLRVAVREFFYDTIRAEKITTIFVTHDTADIAGADRVIRLGKFDMESKESRLSC